MLITVLFTTAKKGKQLYCPSTDGKLSRMWYIVVYSNVVSGILCGLEKKVWHMLQYAWIPLQCSCLENPRDRGAWWVAVYGVAQSRARLKRLSNSSRETREQEKLRGVPYKARMRRTDHQHPGRTWGLSTGVHPAPQSGKRSVTLGEVKALWDGVVRRKKAWVWRTKNIPLNIPKLFGTRDQFHER